MEIIIYDKELMEKKVLEEAFNLIILKIKNERGYNFENVKKIKDSLIKKNEICQLIKNKMKILLKKKRFDINEIVENKKNDEDLIKSLYNKSIKVVCELLKDIINYLEDDLALSTALFSNLSLDNEDFRLILDKFDETKNYNGIKYIYFGFNLVGLFKDYKKLYYEISNITKNSQKIDLKESIILNENYQFKKKLDSLIEIKFLFNDYILYFIYLVIEVNASKDNINQIINFLNMILKIYFFGSTEVNLYSNDYIDIIIDKKGELPDYFLNMCLFFEEHKKFLSIILDSLNDFLPIIPKVNEIFINIYYKNNIKFNKLSKVFETFLDCINDESNFSPFFNKNTKNNYIQLLQKYNDKFREAQLLIMHDYSLSKMNMEIFLYITKIEKYNENSALLKNTIKFLSKGRENNYDLSFITNESNFDNKVFLNVLIKQHKQNSKNFDIIDVFISKDNFYEYSLLFFGNIFEDFITKDIQNIENSNRILFCPDIFNEKIKQLISKGENNRLKYMIIYFFESYFENFYFKKIEENEKDKKKQYQKILLDNSSNIVADYLDYSDKIDIIDLKLLCGIGFMKIYFKYFVNIMYEMKNGNEYIDFDELMKNKIYLKYGKINIITEIRHNLSIKCNKRNIRLEQFIKDNNISYLEEDNDKDGNQKKIMIHNIPNFVPNRQILKEKFNSKEENRKKYPLLNQFINNDEKIKYLKNLPIIIYITNKMLDIYSYRKTVQEIKETKLNDNEINVIKMKIKNFDDNMQKYIECYNKVCDNKLVKSCFSEENYINKSVELFLINENNNNNQLNYIINNFINYQNDFISQISDKYYINNEIKDIHVQDATIENVPKFCSSDDEFLSILIKNTLMKNNKEIFDFDFEDIENDLSEKLLPGLKKFIVGKIKTMKYKGDAINDEILDDFKEKYKPEKLNKEQEEYINSFLENEENKSKNFLKAIKDLMHFIMAKSDYNLNTKIQDIINNIKENFFENNEIDLIKSLFFGDIEEDDELAQMNNNNNIVFSVNNLYPIYIEMEKYLKKSIN